MPCVNDDHPLGGDEPSGDDPFGAMPFLGDLGKLFGGGGGANPARQLAMAIASDGVSEANVDPAIRIKLEQLARVAELQIADATGLAVTTTGAPLEIEAVNRTGWVQGSLDAYDPILDELSAGLAQGMATPATEDLPSDDPMAAMLAGVFSMMAPMMSGMTTGSMIGHLGRRSLGTYDLPIPRPPSDTLLVVVPNLDEFGEDWSLSADDLHMWVCLHEVAHHAVLNVPHVRERLLRLLTDHAGAFRPDGSALEEQFGEVELGSDPLSSMQDLQKALGDPEMILGAVQSDEQREILPFLAALVAVIEGYIDHVMDTVGTRLIESYPMLTEALRRRRVEVDASDRFVEKIFGLELTQAQYDRGSAFIAGVLERSDDADVLHRMWEDEALLPTPNEVDAPGLWLARIDLPDPADAGDTDEPPTDESATD